MKRASALNSAAFIALAAAAVLLPFELKTPVVSLGSIAVTNVEAALYMALGLWAACRVGRTDVRPGPTLVHAAVAAWAGALLLSAWQAPESAGAATKFALRGVGASLLFFATADLVTSRRRAAALGAALATGATVSAATALVEMWLPGTRALLDAFKTQPSYAGGFLRASGTFQYANTAAMYWEASLPLVLGLGVWYAARARMRWIAVFGAAGLVGQALVLSASRAALWSAIALLVVLAASSRWTHRQLRTSGVVLVAALIAFTLLGSGSGGLLAVRLQAANESDWLRATFESVPQTLEVAAGQWISVPLAVRNTGLLAWPTSGTHPVHLSYHWYAPDGETVVSWEGERTPLPSSVEPGRQVRFPAAVFAPVPPGRYALELDMVQERVSWFSTIDFESWANRLLIPVEVTRPHAASQLPRLPPPFKLVPSVRPPRLALWRAAVELWWERPLLGVGPDNFRHLYGRSLGLRDFDDRTHAGSLYVETLAGTGLVGLLTLMGLVLAIGLTIARRWPTLRDQRVRGLTAGVILAGAAFYLHGAVDYFLSFTPTYGLFWLLTGLIVAVTRQEDPC